MRKKWQTVLSIILYVVILACALDFNLLKLVDIRLIFLTLLGTLMLTLPFHEKGMKWQELTDIFGRKAIASGFIQAFLLLFSILQNVKDPDEMFGDIALCFRPLLYGFCLFLLFEKPEPKQTVPAADKGSGEEPGKAPPDMHEFAKVYRLTRRETEITQLVMQGKSNAEIAGELFISETTVKKHVSNIFEKTGVGRREELILKNQGFFNPPDSRAP